MKHTIDPKQAGPYGPLMVEAISTCVHCGFCLPTCPTYRVLGQEMDSPRGRIVLMKEVLEGSLDPHQVSQHIDQCLGCLACETACPSMVQYGQLIRPFRAELQRRRTLGNLARFKQLLVSRTLPYPWRFRLALWLCKVIRPWRHLVPAPFRPMMQLAPSQLPAPYRLQAIYRPATRRARVALLTGCAQQVLAPHINQSTIAVLLANGVEVVVPRRQGCCGALAWHVGDDKTARRMARANLRAFPSDVDAIVTNAAGCGSALHEYSIMFHGDALESAAKEFSQRVRDVSPFLVELGLVTPPPLARPIRVAYHDACHLAHAQKVTAEPRLLLRSIGNLELVPLRDSDLCCGSAGTYNLDQPDIANELGRQKARAIMESGCDAVAMGNIGCLIQTARHLAELGSSICVQHTMEVLAAAYRGGREAE